MSARAEADGQGRLPHYRPPSEAAGTVGDSFGDGTAAGGPAWYDLIAIGADSHVNSVFGGTVLVRKRYVDPTVTIHPDDAARDGIEHGQAIEVGNERGRFRAVATVAAGTRPGVAATTKGWWGMGVNATVAERDSDMGRGAVFHDNRVWIRPASAGPA